VEREVVDRNELTEREADQEQQSARHEIFRQRGTLRMPGKLGEEIQSMEELQEPQIGGCQKQRQEHYEQRRRDDEQPTLEPLP
jgi:hypothetical protein